MISLAAVALHVSDIERSLTFWQDILGMRRNFDTGWTSDPAVFQPSGIEGASAVRMVNLAAPEVPPAPPGPGQASGITLMEVKAADKTAVCGRFSDPGTVHISLWVDDFDGRIADFAAAGFASLGPVTASVVGENIRLAMIADPDGFTLELISAK